MNQFVSELAEHTKNLPMYMIVIIAIILGCMAIWALYSLGKFFLKLLGFPKEKQQVYGKS